MEHEHNVEAVLHRVLDQPLEAGALVGEPAGLEVDVKVLMEADISDDNGQGALGQALRGLRQRAGITQEELGARVGIDSTYISRVEGGRINLRWGTLQRLLRALDATIADLAGELEVPAREKAGGENG